MGTSCLNILNMLRSILSGVGLLIVGSVVNNVVNGDFQNQNEQKNLWSNFKFPDNNEDFSGSSATDDASWDETSFGSESGDVREGRHLGGGFGGFDPCGGYGGGIGGGIGGGHGGGYGGHGGNSQQVLYSLQYLALQLVEYVQALQTGGHYGGHNGGFGGNYGGFGGNYAGFGGNHGGLGGFGGLGGLWRSGRNFS